MPYKGSYHIHDSQQAVICSEYCIYHHSNAITETVMVKRHFTDASGSTVMFNSTSMPLKYSQ